MDMKDLSAESLKEKNLLLVSTKEYRDLMEQSIRLDIAEQYLEGEGPRYTDNALLYILGLHKIGVDKIE